MGLQLFELQPGAFLPPPMIQQERIFVFPLCHIYACNTSK